MNTLCPTECLRSVVFSAWAKRLIPFVTAFLCTLPALAQQVISSLPRTTLNAGIHRIDAEVASDDAARARGLMFRQSLGASEGMLFVFARRDTQCFWMRNTVIPLSIAFLDDDGTVINVADMAAQTDTAHCSAQPVRYALEMNQGWFAARGIAAQSVIDGLP